MIKTFFWDLLCFVLLSFLTSSDGNCGPKRGQACLLFFYAGHVQTLSPPLSGISGLSFDSTFLSIWSLVILPSPVAPSIFSCGNHLCCLASGTASLYFWQSPVFVCDLLWQKETKVAGLGCHNSPYNIIVDWYFPVWRCFFYICGDLFPISQFPIFWWHVFNVLIWYWKLRPERVDDIIMF